MSVLEIFITSLVIFGALLIFLAAPLYIVTWRRTRLTTARNFVLGALFIALLCATLETVSKRQVLQCIEAGHSDCFDSGAAGLQLLFVGLYAVTSWANAYLISRD